jgi:hypothetical protein
MLINVLIVDPLLDYSYAGAEPTAHNRGDATLPTDTKKNVLSGSEDRNRRIDNHRWSASTAGWPVGLRRWRFSGQ